MPGIRLAAVSIMDTWRATWERFQRQVPWLAYGARRGVALGMGYLFANTWLGYSSAVVLPVWLGGCVESLIWEFAVPRWTAMGVPTLPHGWRGVLTAALLALPGAGAALACGLILHRVPGVLGTIAGIALLNGILGWLARGQTHGMARGDFEPRPWVAKMLRRFDTGSINQIETTRIS